LDMTEHNRIRASLGLLVANGLSAEEQSGVLKHLRECELCRAELTSLRVLAIDLKNIPQPQPSLGLAQRTRARVAAEMAAKAEREQQQRYLVLMIGFAWIVTALTFLTGRFLVADVAAWLRISQGTCVTAFISYMIFAGIASIAFAGLLATRHRNERRLI